MRQLYNFKNKFIRLSSKEKEYTRFHSQFGEDRYIYEHINLPDKGVFVDVGAGHPIKRSNTYFFEKNGWTGICIDTDPYQYELLRKYRANAEWAAISNQEGEIDFSRAYLSDYSSLIGKEKYNSIAKVQFKDVIRVPCFKLETILTKHKIDHIDILNIDVEGTELEVWNSFNYTKHKPRIVVIEYFTFGLSNNLEEIKEFFSRLPYKLVHTTCTNLIYLHQDT